MPAAPVCLFTYNRLDHTQRTVEALAANHLATETPLTVFADGARGADDRASVQAVVDYVRNLDRSLFASIDIVEREQNLGLSVSLIDGVTTMLQNNERVIVVEDDLVTSPWFLQFMNDGLDTYAGDDRVASIHGYVYPIDATGLADTFFLRTGDCWGWATWRDAWTVFEPNGHALLDRLEAADLTSIFDLDDSYPYTQMLRHQTRGLAQSWAIRWSASVLLADQLTLYPSRSLVHNIGNDGSGTHGLPTDKFDGQLWTERISVGGIEIAEDPAGRLAVADYLAATRPSRLRTLAGPYAKKALRRLSRLGSSTRDLRV